MIAPHSLKSPVYRGFIFKVSCDCIPSKREQTAMTHPLMFGIEGFCMHPRPSAVLQNIIVRIRLTSLVIAGLLGHIHSAGFGRSPSPARETQRISSTMILIRIQCICHSKHNPYQSKCLVHIPRGEVGAFAVDIQEPILGGGIQHGLPHGGVMGIGDVDDGELDWDCICHSERGCSLGSLQQDRGHRAYSSQTEGLYWASAVEPIAYLQYPDYQIWIQPIPFLNSRVHWLNSELRRDSIGFDKPRGPPPIYVLRLSV